jgi:hypothetical protein
LSSRASLLTIARGVQADRTGVTLPSPRSCNAAMVQPGCIIHSKQCCHDIT